MVTLFFWGGGWVRTFSVRIASTDFKLSVNVLGGREYCVVDIRTAEDSKRSPPASASNSGRIDGASVCVRKGPTLKVIR
jgi:hypothetical protein